MKTGKEQMVIFFFTLIVTLVTDLLIGIATGIAVKGLFVIIVNKGVKNIFSPKTNQVPQEATTTLEIEGALLFSNFIGFKKKLDKIPADHKVMVDLEKTT